MTHTTILASSTALAAAEEGVDGVTSFVGRRRQQQRKAMQNEEGKSKKGKAESQRQVEEGKKFGENEEDRLSLG